MNMEVIPRQRIIYPDGSYSEASIDCFVLDQNVYILFSNVCLSSSSALCMVSCT